VSLVQLKTARTAQFAIVRGRRLQASRVREEAREAAGPQVSDVGGSGVIGKIIRSILHRRPTTYFAGCVIGFHSRASFCASAICSGVMCCATKSRFFAATLSPCTADKLSHMYART